MPNLRLRSFLLCLGLLTSVAVQAAVTNVRLYRLGENDGGATALLPGDNPTIEDIISANAAKVGLTFYHGIGGGGGPAISLGLVPGSTFSMEFTNVDSRYAATAALNSRTENFGLEAYIQVSVPGADGRTFYNGDTGAPLDTLTRGYGIGISGGKYAALIGGSTFLTSVTAVPNQPVEMALVNVGATSFEVYVQRKLALSFTSPFALPLAADVLSIGNFVGNQSPPSFAGVVDEARVFTFASGGFDPTNDLGAAAVPEPASILLFMAGLAALLVHGSSRQRNRGDATAQA